MMKKVFHSTLSVLMAFVVMFTTMSFTVDMHYCGDSLVDFSLFSKAEGCGMEKAQPAKDCENPLMTEKSCCTNQQILQQGQDELKTSLSTLTFEQQTFVATFFYTYINFFEGLDENIVSFTDYPPPFIRRDLQVLHQTFLI